MNTTEQLAVITKKAWFTKNIGLATRTSRLAADCDSGWRIMAEDEDEKCFDRLEQLELVPLEKICQLEPAFAEIMEQAEKGLIVTLIVKDYCAIIGLNQKDLENQGILASSLLF